MAAIEGYNLVGSPRGALGPCNAYYDVVPPGVTGYTGQNLFLGITQGGINIKNTDEKVATVGDQLGTKPWNQYHVGRECSVSIPLAQSTQEKLSIFNGIWTLPDKTGLAATFPIGQPDYENSKIMKFVLLDEGIESVNDDDIWYYFHMAPNLEAEWMFDTGTQRVTSAAFMAYLSGIFFLKLKQTGTQPNINTGNDEPVYSPDATGDIELPIYWASKTMLDGGQVIYKPAV